MADLEPNLSGTLHLMAYRVKRCILEGATLGQRDALESPGCQREIFWPCCGYLATSGRKTKTSKILPRNSR
jgi:hypothetical protein